MKLQLQNLASLAILFNPASAQLISYNDATLIACNAYSNITRQRMTAGQPLKPRVDYIFVTPPTTASIRGGSPCPEAVTNHELSDCADSLQKPGELLIKLDDRSYFNSMEMKQNLTHDSRVALNILMYPVI
jgi:hypothetical protein